MKGNGHNSTLTPELKDWLDRVIVPALVREYIAQFDSLENPLALDSEPVAECAAKSTATAEGAR